MDAGTLCEPIALDPASSIRVERVERPSDSAAPTPFPHFHEPAELIWFNRADGEVTTEHGVFPITAGTLLFLPSMTTHDFRLAAGATAWVLVHLDPSVTVAGPGFGSGILSSPRWHCPPKEERARLAMAFDWLVTLAARPERSADVLALTRLLLKELPLPDPAADMTAAGLALHRLRPALDLVAAVTDRPVTIEDAAARCHLSPTYFSRAFSKQFGVGFSEYARQYRLRSAARSLTMGGSRVSEIAYSNGFFNPSHFSAAFQKRFGISPSQFRKAYQTRR
ncbi:AraC family transcriptional regulator [uncultured Erythrobacter sp.]|uniref:AraC family transcriptional regulator n=1 Tax=uncultured Erythrobacter sp. TaxID=263913 RepID=UPI00265B3784|nr:AraC family transcriptional regulator [uncultured Erythrobacter sp.]